MHCFCSVSTKSSGIKGSIKSSGMSNENLLYFIGKSKISR